MKRIDTATIEVDANGSGKDGFTDGEPGVTPRTIVDAEHMNNVQEEICNVIELNGHALDPDDPAQLARAVLQPAASFAITVPVGTSPRAATFVLIEQNIADMFVIQASDTEIAPALLGTYLVTVHLQVVSDDTTNPLAFWAFIRDDSGATNKRFKLSNTRFSATPGDPVTLSGSALMQLGEEELGIGLRLDVAAAAGNVVGYLTAPSSDDYNAHLHIVRVGPLAPV